MNDLKVWQCAISVRLSTKPPDSAFVYTCDMVFIDGRPYLVLDWNPHESAAANDEPGRKIPLEPAELVRVLGNPLQDFAYALPFQDPEWLS